MLQSAHTYYSGHGSRSWGGLLMGQYFIFWASAGLLGETMGQGKRCKGYPCGAGGRSSGYETSPREEEMKTGKKSGRKGGKERSMDWLYSFWKGW